MKNIKTMNLKNQSNRRGFIKKTSTAAVFTIVPRFVLGGSGYVPPSDRLILAMVGTGGRGMNNLKSFLQHDDVQIAAIADVTEEADYSDWYYKEPGGRKPGIEQIKRRYGDDAKCNVYIDFRKMLEVEKTIDAVVVSIPDFSHTVVALDAIRRGKHVYVEKPLAHTIYEVRKLTEEAKKAGVVTQMGIQGHADEGLRLTAEWIKDGAIGAVHEVHAWSDHVNRSGCMEGWPQGNYDIPKGLDWNLWLGPAKYRPYHPAYTPASWRDFWDFGTGKIGDMGCHNMDPAFFALDLGYPEWIEARIAYADEIHRPFASMVFFQFPARGNKPPVKLVWYGGLIPPTPEDLEPGRQLTGGGNGILFIGKKGKMMCGGWAGTPRLIPETKMKAYQLPPKTLARTPGIYRDWIDAIKNGRKSCADFEYCGPMTEVVLAGAVAMRCREKLYWDGPGMKATNYPDAERFIVPEYCNGWTLE
ncbi:Gfo/Idh/MocA family oxidoreductase [candidate division KSB1 bacterium]|nr:Gfo/Idh/MocA family oxidoreductase [candidate division KSB1 bacterium]